MDSEVGDPEIKRARDTLRQGGVVAHATEGVWGLACDPFCQPAVERIVAIKGRDVEKGLLLIAHDASVFQEELREHSSELQKRVLASWPGAHTWVLPNHRFSNTVTGGRHTVACRVPGHEQARQLCAAFAGPLVSTSANRSGQPALTEEADVIAELGQEVDLVLSGRVLNPGMPSTIHGLNGEQLR